MNNGCPFCKDRGCHVSGMNCGLIIIVRSVFCSFVFKGTVRLFSSAARPFYLATSNVWPIQVLQILKGICYRSLLFILAVRIVTRWYLVMVLIVFLRLSGVLNMFSCAYLQSTFPLPWNVSSCVLPILELGFLLEFSEISIRSGHECFRKYMAGKYFITVCSLSFHSLTGSLAELKF